MAIFRCKMCGGDLEIQEGQAVCTCEYCGTEQTLPRLDTDRKANLYDRANHFRRNNDFDKAMSIYEQILNEDNTDSEAYWSLVLCRYGIEYVEDPATHKRIPTINRAQYTSIYADENYKSAINYASTTQKIVYENEARTIDEIQKGILEISEKEEPFDVFICYKETDDAGRRTPDSVLANELYHQLTQESFKVFFSRITLEDKLGQEYEPYIFAALNSAKVMVVLGTKPEYFKAVWVRNEWSRYLALIKNGAQKMLIPAYKDMDPYDLPDEFSHLQAQDMSKLGFMQDLIRGIKKIIGAEQEKQSTKETVIVQQGGVANIEPLLKRTFMFLEDGSWNEANEYCERVLDQDPENAQAYLAKLMAELHVRKQDDLKNCKDPFDKRNNYLKVMRFADKELVDKLKGYIAYINDRNENARLNGIYNNAVKEMQSASAEDEYKSAATAFKSITGFKDASKLAGQCLEKAEICRKDKIYNTAKGSMKLDEINSYQSAIKIFQTIKGWKDSDEQVEFCYKRIEEIKAKEEAEHLEAERRAEELRIEAEREAEERRIKAEFAAKKKKRIITIAISIVCACTVFLITLEKVIIPQHKYGEAEKLLSDGQIVDAAFLFGKIADYRDAYDRSVNLWNNVTIRNSVSAGSNHTVGLKSDGTVVTVGDNEYGQRDVSDWTDIVAIAAGSNHTVGLKSDGTVITVGSNIYGQCDVSDWVNIVAIVAGSNCTVGLKSDGTVVAIGYNGYGQCDVSDWTDIVAITAGSNYTVGLKSDGTVVAVGINLYGQCNVSDWTDIAAIAAGSNCTVGLKSDGTVVAVGYNGYGQCDVSDWTDIIAIAAGSNYTVGLKSDGTVITVGSNIYGQCDVSDWVDIVAIAAGGDYTVGLKSYGTVVAVGFNKYGRCDVSDWKGIRVP